MGRWRIAVAFFVIVMLQIVSAKHQVAAQESYSCVQATQKDYLEITVASVTLNVATGTSPLSSRPVVSPGATYSPDKQYAVFWQQIIPDKVGYYLAPTTGFQATLLYETDRNDAAVLVSSQYRPPLAAWSPDSRAFAFITTAGDHYVLNVISTDGKNRQAKIFRPVPGKSAVIWDVALYGWSADSAYLAAVVNEYTGVGGWFGADVRIWPSKDISSETKLDLMRGIGDPFAPVAWSPGGHKLALTLDIGDRSTEAPGAKLAIWSPEHGVEMSTSVELTYDYYRIHWPPPGNIIWLNDFWGHGEGVNNFYYVGDGKFTLRGGSRGREIIGWSGSETALVYDWHDQQLLLLNIKYGYKTLIDTGTIYSDNIWVSPDGKWVAYLTSEGSEVVGYRYHAAIVGMDGQYGRTFFSSGIGAGLGSPTAFDWSADSNYLTFGWFSKVGGNDVERFIVTSPDGSFTRNLDHWIAWLNPTWAVADTVEQGITSLKLMNVKTGEFINLASAKVNDSDDKRKGQIFASMSPDGRSVAAVLNGYTLALYSLDTRTVKQIPIRVINTEFFWDNYTSHDAGFVRERYFLSWSPDNSMLAYVENSENTSELVVLNREGQELRRISLNALRNQYNVFMGTITWTQCMAEF